MTDETKTPQEATLESRYRDWLTTTKNTVYVGQVLAICRDGDVTIAAQRTQYTNAIRGIATALGMQLPEAEAPPLDAVIREAHRLAARPVAEPQRVEVGDELRAKLVEHLRDIASCQAENCKACQDNASEVITMFRDAGLLTGSAAPKPTVPEAMRIVCRALSEDPDYRIAWVANIAMQFKDRMIYSSDLKVHMRAEDVHRIANAAAEEFIDMLCKDEITDSAAPGTRTERCSTYWDEHSKRCLKPENHDGECEYPLTPGDVTKFCDRVHATPASKAQPAPAAAPECTHPEYMRMGSSGTDGHVSSRCTACGKALYDRKIDLTVVDAVSRNAAPAVATGPGELTPGQARSIVVEALRDFQPSSRDGKDRLTSFLAACCTAGEKFIARESNLRAEHARAVERNNKLAIDVERLTHDLLTARGDCAEARRVLEGTSAELATLREDFARVGREYQELRGFLRTIADAARANQSNITPEDSVAKIVEALKAGEKAQSELAQVRDNLALAERERDGLRDRLDAAQAEKVDQESELHRLTERLADTLKLHNWSTVDEIVSAVAQVREERDALVRRLEVAHGAIADAGEQAAQLEQTIIIERIKRNLADGTPTYLDEADVEALDVFIGDLERRVQQPQPVPAPCGTCRGAKQVDSLIETDFERKPIKRPCPDCTGKRPAARECTSVERNVGKCTLPAGHAGRHENHLATWPNLEAASAPAQPVKPAAPVPPGHRRRSDMRRVRDELNRVVMASWPVDDDTRHAWFDAVEGLLTELVRVVDARLSASRPLLPGAETVEKERA